MRTFTTGPEDFPLFPVGSGRDRESRNFLIHPALPGF